MACGSGHPEDDIVVHEAQILMATKGFPLTNQIDKNPLGKAEKQKLITSGTNFFKRRHA
jgi:hypothetical protein